MILGPLGIVKGSRGWLPLTSVSEYDRLGAARRAGAGVSVTVGNSVLGLYNLVRSCYYRYMASNEHPTAELMDQLVMRTQEVADLYVRCIDENPGASVAVPRDAEQLDQLFKALAGFVLAEGRAISAISRYYSAEFDPAYAELPEQDDF